MEPTAAQSNVLHLNNNLETQSRIIEAIHEANEDPGIFISKRGIKFRMKMVSSRIGMEVARSIEMPKPPVFKDDDGRERENPLDPTYNDERQQAMINKGIMVMNANIGLGTEVIFVPEGVQRAEDKEWSEDLDYFTKGVIKVPEERIPRYLAWIHYYALVGNEASDLNNAILRYSGVVLEADVTSASENFQSDETRDTSEGVSSSEES